MASMAAAKKNLCATCEKNTGIFTCGGCSLAFCTKHANEHRQILSKQMDEIVFVHDQIRQSINEQIHEVNQCPPMKEIDEWERQLIHRICQIANNAREKLTQCLKERTKHIQTEVQKLTEKLNKARIEDDFVENDLKLWSDKINKLKTDISTSIPIFVKSIDNDLTLLVSQSHPQNDVEVQMNKSIFTSPEHQVNSTIHITVYLNSFFSI
jgi:gas vesicle protein